ncbi:MMPL family transporter [Demequina aurantiaca]|uniref:MMPL family transporter n=1 Tax=Demequina aurantiaca TaxID=676200 RepID=UPI003D337DD3
MTLGITGRIARASASRPWLTIGIWGAILVGAVVLAGSLGNHVTSLQKNLVTTEADRASQIDMELRSTATGAAQYDETVFVTSADSVYGEPLFDDAVASAAAALSAVEGVTDVVTPDAGASVADNGRSAMITFHTTADAAVVTAAVDAIDTLGLEGVDAFVYGEESSQLALTKLASDELARSEGIGIIAALVILVFVFGAFVAAGLPLLIAIVSIVTATALGSVVAAIADANDVPMSDTVTIFIAMLGLALGIDYSLLCVQRFREELAHGRTVSDAVAIAGNTANRAVVVSGATIVIALGGLVFVPVNTFLGVGVGVMAVALTSVCSAVFLLPAILQLLGHRVNKGRVPTAHPGAESPRWRRIALRVVRRPVVSALVGVGALMVLAAPVLGLRFANPGPEDLPADFVAHQASDVMTQDFGWTESETVVVVENAGDARAQVTALSSAIESDEAFAGTTVEWRTGTAFIETHDTFGASDAGATLAIERLREQLVPDALEGSGARVSVGGARAFAMDQELLLTDRAPWVVAFILSVTFILLFVMFRSVVIPLKAVVLNLLGTLATFGAMVAVYQWGWGSWLGLPHLDGISPFMPVMIFALVFGLSMDYHVFLLSRIKESYDATEDNRAAVVDGVTRTGPLITGAALIMFAVFGGFASAGIPELSQWGFGLAFGVLIDATLIRMLLVPASMVWLGRANWYLPRWLEWLPTFTVEAPEPAPAVHRHPETAGAPRA